MKQLAIIGALLLTGCMTPKAMPERSIAELSADMAAGRTSSEELVATYLKRIDTIDRAGPTLRSVIATNPEALAQARALDAERRAKGPRGPLHGVPILVKDNIETRDAMATTAGSLALAANVTRRDAPLIARLRAAGAVILGKTNLSEWANFRDGDSTSGWSAVGGLVKNPYALDRNACGSSSGSGAAVAADLAPAAIGTETDGSIACPANMTGLVGLKPTVGLISRTFVVPISASQDTPGPMTRSVADAALLLTAMAGSDPADAATAGADARKRDYAAALTPDVLKGRRIGVLRYRTGHDARVDALFEAALAQLRERGAELVDIAESGVPRTLGDHELKILLTEFKAGLNAYLATTPPAVTTRTLAEIIAFNAASEAEMKLFGQRLFVDAEATKGLDDPDYLKARTEAKRLAGADGIDRLLGANRVTMLVAPTMGPAWMTDLVNGDQYSGGSSSQLAAVAGYPHLTVPMGLVKGLPVGLSFIGPAWSEAELLAAGHAYEQASRKWRAPTFVERSTELP
ncbi:amidase [Sphingoaurantiacus capsulatus]|uniref:Amidase n=1 Tax=Sphingoaurantiacus capsulatus TaxID=1771310 RepID=A0ABV7XFJ2_9SPHN